MVGDLTINYESVAVLGDPEQTLCLYTAEPGSPSENALRLLANWTGTPSTADRDADLPTS
ncbi:DNA-binding protein [Mycolicibacterium novocastrense]|uniref:DNA-binding protein n=1 Tax=Mycolicibacterium novocastrense TaxID=59813 RepID=A0ABQ0KU90_MYCNV|nr:DNA-binding protein [Mycolicibacterium novocastrense]